MKVPTLNVAGWWDQEDFYGPLAIYDALERHDTHGLSRLVVGPWNHGGWNAVPGDKLGAIPFDSATSKYFPEEAQAPFFAYYLKDRGRLELPEALTFESGSNRWRQWDAWPPRAGVEARPAYFGEGHTLSFVKPTSADPAHPVPYRHRPIQATYFPGGSKWYDWLVEDQRFVADRPDVLSFETPPLEEALTIAGEVTARLYASTTGSDTDWVVKLIDVYPEKNPEDWSLAGYQLMVSNEVFRAVTEGVRDPATHPARRGRGVLVQPPHPEPRLPEGSPPDGAGAEQLVPPHRPQPADVRAEHLRGEAGGLPGGHAPGPPLGPLPVTRQPARDRGRFSRPRGADEVGPAAEDLALVPGEPDVE